MIQTVTAANQTVLFGVTSSQSLKLLGEIPSRMAELGWKVHLVAGDASWGRPSNLDGLPLHEIPMRRNPSPITDTISFVRWVSLLIKVKPSIVVIGTPKAAFLGILAARLCRVPFRIYHLRGLRLQTVNGPARVFLYLLEWITARLASSILAVSASLKQEYIAQRLSPETKLDVIGLGSSHGVDIHHFDSRRWNHFQAADPRLQESVAAGTPILGFVGRFSIDKGAGELLQCVEILSRTKTRHMLLIIGPEESDEGVLDRLRGLNSSIVITGPVADVAPYYSLMDLLLLPSHREGFPNTVLEAAASGVPAITTKVTGAIDSVIHGVTGFVIPSHDGVALAKTINRLLAEPNYLVEMGTNARKWARCHFESSQVSNLHAEYLTKFFSKTE